MKSKKCNQLIIKPLLIILRFCEKLILFSVKVVVMMLGELEYEDLYYPKNEKLNNKTQEIDEVYTGQFFKV